jgi:hypothetical protein
VNDSELSVDPNSLFAFLGLDFGDDPPINDEGDDKSRDELRGDNEAAANDKESLLTRATCRCITSLRRLIYKSVNESVNNQKQ